MVLQAVPPGLQFDGNASRKVECSSVPTLLRCPWADGPLATTWAPPMPDAASVTMLCLRQRACMGALQKWQPMHVPLLTQAHLVWQLQDEHAP